MIEDGLRTATGALASSVAANIPVHVVQTFTVVALNATLALPGPKVVVVPNGAYTINAPLLVPSQTIVQLQPQAVLTRNITGLGLTHAMWQNSTPSTGNTDIAILGGQYTTATTGELFGFTKVTRLRIRDCYGSSISGGDYLMLLSDCVKVWIEELVHETADGAPGQDGIHIQGQCKGRLGNVQAAFEAIDAPMSHTNLIIGRYAETFHTTPVPKVSFLMLDSDFYAAEILCWRKFWPQLSPGAYVFMDDYFYWPGCYKAANEFLEAVGQKRIQINRVGRAAWIQRRL